ncbi:MAG: phage major capsid protein [Terriglobales bacterium]
MKRKRGSFFNGAGEKRKFYNNMRHFGGTRNISLTFLGFAPMLGPVAVLALIVTGIVMMLGGIGHFSEFAGASTHGKHGFAHAVSYGAVAVGLAAAAVPDFKGLMSLQQKRVDLIKANEALIDLAEKEDRDFKPEEQATHDANIAQLKSVNARIDRIEGLRTAQASLLKKPVQSANNPGASVQCSDEPRFESMGEQLMAVARYTQSNGENRDPRLVAVGSQKYVKLVAEGLIKGGFPENKAMAAAAGLNESTPAEGGFLVQGDLAEGILQRTYETGEILSQMPEPIEISSSSNRTSINAIDESSRANGSRFGGVQVFWSNEAAAITATKPKFRRLELILNKLTGLCYATDEMLADAAVMNSVINNVFPLEFSFRIEDAIFNGLGGGQPIGFLQSPSLITVAAEAAQPTATIVSANVLKMWSRCWGRSRKTALWCIDQSIEPQLYSMTVGTGGGATAVVYMPPGGLSSSPYGTLFGRPVIPTEYNAALGTAGDITLFDPSQIAFARKGLMQAATSMHVNFTTDEMAFRFIMRLDAQPTWNKPLTPKNGGNTLSPFVTLAARP